MSLIDGIFSGITHAVKGMLGIDDEQPRNDDAAARTTSPASSTPTTFTARPTPAKVSSLLDAVERYHATRTTTPVSTAPIQGANRPSPRARIVDPTTDAPLGTADTLTGTGTAATAARNVQHGIDWLQQTFGRDGVDDASSGVDVMVDDRSLDSSGHERFQGNGGYYRMPDATGAMREAIHFGTGVTYQGARGLVDQLPLQYADDLTIHELMHGVINAESGQIGGDANEAGATNEAIADVLAASATRDWKLGEGMYAADSSYRMMRNIANPNDPTAVHGLWTTIGEVRRRQQQGEPIEEHWASGVISTAAQRMQARIGGEQGWQVVEHLYYDAVNDHRLGDMSFAAVAAGLRTSAAARYGTGSQVALIVDEELRRAGL